MGGLRRTRQCLVIDGRSGESSGQKREFLAGRSAWDATGKQGHITISQIAPPDRQTTSTSLFTTSTAPNPPANLLTISPPTASKKQRDTHSYAPTLPPTFASCGKPTSRSQTRTGHASASPPSSMIDEVSITISCTECMR